MKVVITIHCDTPAFKADPENEAALILERLVRELEWTPLSKVGLLPDSHGLPVGKVEVLP